MRTILAICLLAGVCAAQPLATFAGSGQDAIAAMVADRQGNLYVAGNTTSPDLAIHHAAFAAS